jgi:hypothetical protein
MSVEMRLVDAEPIVCARCNEGLHPKLERVKSGPWTLWTQKYLSSPAVKGPHLVVRYLCPDCEHLLGDEASSFVHSKFPSGSLEL